MIIPGHSSEIWKWNADVKLLSARLKTDSVLEVLVQKVLESC